MLTNYLLGNTITSTKHTEKITDAKKEFFTSVTINKLNCILKAV